MLKPLVWKRRCVTAGEVVAAVVLVALLVVGLVAMGMCLCRLL